MNTRIMGAALALALISNAAMPSLAEPAGSGDLQVELESGYRHDSNLGVEELDRAASRGDDAVLLKGRAEGSWALSPALTLAGGYQVSSQNYRQMDAFDTLTQLAHGSARYQLGGYDLGASFHYAVADLDGEDFLTFRQPTLSLGRQVAERWYWRLALAEQRKTFDPLPHRDADNRSLGGELFYVASPSQVWSASLTALDENAVAESFDYRGWRWRVQWSREFAWGSRRPSVQLAWQHERRDYGAQSGDGEQPLADLPIFGDVGASPAMGDHRDDRSDSVRLAMDMPLGRMFSLAGQVDYGDHRSTLDTWDYDRTQVSVSAKWRF